MSARFWFGEKMNQWARQWVTYWTEGQGVFVMSAEEDTGVMQALTQLAGGRHIDLNRVLLLRGGSDYTVPPPGMSAPAQLAKANTEGFPGTPPALDNLYRVAAPVARALEEGWARTRDHIPGGAP
jgi:purine nucleoside permease